MEQKSGEPGFFTRLREYVVKQDIQLVPVTEHNFPRLEPVLQALADEAKLQSQTGNPNETTEEWVRATKGVWLFGAPEQGKVQNEAMVGFVSVYEPEHMDKINEWLTKKAGTWRPYEPGQVLEMSGYAKNPPLNAEKDLAASKLTLLRVFALNKEQFGDVKAVSIWLTHNADNTLDPLEVSQMKDLGAMALGSTKYSSKDNVDSTCFLITRKHFMDNIIPQSSPVKSPKPAPVTV